MADVPTAIAGGWAVVCTAFCFEAGMCRETVESGRDRRNDLQLVEVMTSGDAPGTPRKYSPRIAFL